jgi:hypothetical protein
MQMPCNQQLGLFQLPLVQVVMVGMFFLMTKGDSSTCGITTEADQIQALTVS